jgi:hypothetical protein
MFIRGLIAFGVVLAAVTFADSASAKKENCKAKYLLGTQVTALIDLGDVAGVFHDTRRNNCVKRARDYCSYAAAFADTYAPSGSANMQSICDAGVVNVNIETSVNDGYGESGTCQLPKPCERTCRDCATLGSWQESNWCVKAICRPTPTPANNTSFISTGYFFWSGDLRYRTDRCPWTRFR